MIIGFDATSWRNLITLALRVVRLVLLGCQFRLLSRLIGLALSAAAPSRQKGRCD
jgi:hypothetical protein